MGLHPYPLSRERGVEQQLTGELAHHHEQIDRSFPQVEHSLEPDGASDRNRLRKRPAIAAIPDTREWSPANAELAYLTVAE